MKKLGILMACLAVCFSLAACGNEQGTPSGNASSGTEDTVKESSASSTTTSALEETKTTAKEEATTTKAKTTTKEKATTTKQKTTTTKDKTTTTVTKKPTSAAGSITMESFIASIQDQIDSMNASTANSGMNLKVFARGKSLVYSYQYTIDLGDTSLIKPSLEQAMDTLSSTFDSVLAALKLAVPDAQSLTVEYLDKDGGVIVSKEYK